MRTTPSRTALALLLGLLLSPAGATAQSRVCHLVTDARGDAAAGPLRVARNPAGNEPAYDVISADVAIDDRTVTAAIRVAKLAKSTTSAPMGMHWRLDFTVLGSATPLFLQAYSTPFGERFDFGYLDGTTSVSYTGARVTGVLDLARNEVRVSAPLAAAEAETIITRGSVIEDLRAAAGRFYNTAGTHPSFSERTDEARSNRSYTAGTASCVPVGR